MSLPCLKSSSLHISLRRQSYFPTRPSQVALVVKNLPASAGDKRHGFDPWVRKIFWRRAWQPTPVFLLGEFHGQRSLVGYIVDRVAQSRRQLVT